MNDLNPIYRRSEMVFNFRTTFLVSLVTLILIIGCSGGGSQDPATPGVSNDELTYQINDKSANSNYFWEIGEVTINPETAEVEVVPLRTADFNLNVVKFLQPPQGNPANLSVVLDIPGSDFVNAFVSLNLTLTHPFPGTSLWGFDTRVVVFAGGSTNGVFDNSVRYPAPTELRIENADGYTRWFNRDEFGPFDKIFGYTEGVLAPNFTANFSLVNGYKYFANGIGTNDFPANPSDASRGSFNTGSVTRHMGLQFPKVPAPFKFKYSVVTSHESPTNSPPQSAADFPLEANTQEAYQVVVTQDPASTAFFDPDDSSFGGDLILDIEIFDWQAEGNPAAQIGAIAVESPTLLSNQGGMVDTILADWTQSAGSSPNSVVFSGTLANVTPNAVEGQDLFVTVEHAGPMSYEPPIPGFLFPASNLAAYHLYVPTILDSGTPPDKSITVTVPNGGETFVIGEPETIQWTWTGAITDVTIEYSTDGGTTYPNVITASTPCDGSFDWDPVPDTPTITAKVRITEAGPSPEAQDESNSNFTISTEAATGWNPVPGQTGIAVDPEPNQSTAMPDLGIQNDGAGAEGAWMVDQEGGTGDGSPIFYDYLLDWSGPGGNEYFSNFNYNFAPMGRHDVSANSIAIFGSSANTNQIAPPVLNDPITCIWYVSYLQADEIASPGDLFTVTWGDEGEGDPPGDDPDLQPWYHTMDTSGGMPGQDGDDAAFTQVWLMGFSEEPGAPIPDDEGELNVGYWIYPYLSSSIYRLPIPTFTSDLDPPVFQAFDVSDKSKVRLAADNDSYFTFDQTLPTSLISIVMISSMADIYVSAVQLDEAGGQFSYIGLQNCYKMFPDDALYYDGGTAIDAEFIPRVTWTEQAEGETNWVAVLFDTGSGSWVVKVYKVDWGVADLVDLLSEIDTTDPLPGSPLALDVDFTNHTIHVLADDGGQIKATVFNYTE